MRPSLCCSFATPPSPGSLLRREDVEKRFAECLDRHCKPGATQSCQLAKFACDKLKTDPKSLSAASPSCDPREVRPTSVGDNPSDAFEKAAWWRAVEEVGKGGDEVEFYNTFSYMSFPRMRTAPHDSDSG
ncbi:hypothetical protein AYL99_06702 [Fonsecaea erecta]|uniref:Uncharacterized protein n=1 Tax=Fonsecaea erecta TaxID=1367422 RepID=A0A178ZHW7_9EURO|nr:hypothetical protein AYL99_06702 [Fonsecaea erecta]OAP59404.1 hypothetical protein AYL99_06702 [Fonsecaea erecta]